MSTFFGLSAVFWIVVGVAAIVGVVLYLKRKGVLRRAADDAKATLDQAATDAAQKVADKLTK